MGAGNSGRTLAAAMASLAGFFIQAYGAAMLRWFGMPTRQGLDTAVAGLGGILGWLALAWLGSSLVDSSLRRYAQLHPGAAPPRLVRDLVRVVVFGAAAMTIAAVVFDQPILRDRPQLAEDLATLMARRQQANRERLVAMAARGEIGEPHEAADFLGRLRAFFGLS